MELRIRHAIDLYARRIRATVLLFPLLLREGVGGGVSRVCTIGRSSSHAAFASLLLALSVFLCPALLAENIQFPPDAGYLDVKTKFGAAGDGVNDDTRPLQAALRNTNGFLYFPNGTYLVSDSITVAGKNGYKRRFLQGQSRDGVIIKLREGSAGFSDPAKPKPVLSLFDLFMDPKSRNILAVRNSIYNLTIDVGAENPGAVALHYFSNDQGTVENVTLRSSDPQKRGKAGLALVTNWPGPAHFSNLRIEGFDYGVWSTIDQFSLSFENLTLMHQRSAGIFNTGQKLSIRRLSSENRVPAVHSEGGSLVIIDAELSGGDAKNAAIESEGGLYARNIRIDGYKPAIRSNHDKQELEEIAAGPHVSEYSSAAPESLFPSSPHSLNLPIEETPIVAWEKPAAWSNVLEFGAHSLRDDADSFDSTEAVRNAFASGKSTVYFPKGIYLINDTIAVKGNVKRVIGMESQIKSGKAFENSMKPLFRFEDGKEKVVIFERFEAAYGNHAKYFFEHAATRTLVIKNVTCDGYKNTGTGKLFLEDVCGGPWEFSHQQVWARQLNLDCKGVKILNDGASLWILNLKTEKPGSALVTKNGGKSEILGGYLYYKHGTDGIPILNQDSSVSVIATLNMGGATKSASLVQETRGVKTKALTAWPFFYSGSREPPVK